MLIKLSNIGKIFGILFYEVRGDSMENNKPSKQTKGHVVNIDNRQRIDLTGVTEVITFNEQNVILNTVLGGLNIKGKNMKVNKLNVDNGDMSIEGEILSIAYISKDMGEKESFLKKLLK